MQQPVVVVVQPEQERADLTALRRVSEPPTTHSAVRIRLIFCMPVRSPERYGSAAFFAMTPSSPAAPSSCIHRSAIARSGVTGDGASPSTAPSAATNDSSAARRSVNGRWMSD